MPSTQRDFMRWYTPVHQPFMRYCQSRTFGWESAEDIAQEAILSALEQWDAVKNKQHLLSYMIGIVNNQVRNRLRSAEVRRRYASDRQRRLSERLPARAELAVDLGYLLNAIDQLPATAREALLLTAVSGFTVREVADIQQTTEGAVKTRISRARRSLRELFDEDSRKLSLAERLRIYTALL